MATNPNNTTITIPKTLLTRLKLSKHKGQNWGGVIEEILDKNDSMQTELIIAKAETEKLKTQINKDGGK